MKNSVSAVIAVAFFLIAGLACSRFSVPGRSENLLEGDAAVRAVAAVKEKVGGPVNVIRISIRPDEMEVTIQSPKNPKDIDKYTYKNGVVAGPEPVQVFSFGDKELTADKYDTTPIDEIGFANIPAAIKQAIELSKLEDAKVNLISMDGQGIEQGSPNIKEERLKEQKKRDEEISEKRAECMKDRSRKDCFKDDIAALEQIAKDFRPGNIGKRQLVLTWRLFVEGPRGRKDFWADKNGKLNEKSF